MFRNSGHVAFAVGFPLLALLVLSAPAVSQQADTFEQHAAVARERAGTEWQPVIDYLCTTGEVIPNQPDHPLIEPVRIFDNVYAVGRSSTVVYIITTSEGLILIDSGYGDQVDSVLLPGMAALDLDPEDIGYVILLHGHGDHFGGATHLQERYGARIVASSPDWDLMDGTIPSRRGPPQGAPRRDVVAVDGVPIELGDTAITPYLVPGHTPGAIGVVFTVRDGADTHTAAIFGGMALSLPFLGDAIPQYLGSIERFKVITEELGVDVVLQNHPMFDGMPEKLERLKSRRAGERHPFVLDGPDSYERFLDTVSACSRAQRAAANGG